MAEGVLFSVADRLIGRLGSFAVQEIDLLRGVEDELLQLQDTISTIKDVLLDAEEKQVRHHQIQNWLKRCEDAVFVADDLLDEFSTEALRRRVMMPENNFANQVCTFFSSSNQLVFQRRMAHKIKNIKKKLDAIAADRLHFHLDVCHEETSTVVRRAREQTYSFVVEEKVRRNKDKMSIIKLLLDTKTQEDVSVIPIVGMGGLEKTTLAQLVFNDNKVQEHFELRMWVCVAENFDVKLLVKKIIKSATNKSPDINLEMDQLQQLLRKTINRKRYLLILDDVWNEDSEKWSSLRDLLKYGAKGSKIIVTTRGKKVAKITGTMQPFDLDVLDEDKSWSLFKLMAFENGQEPMNSRIVECGRNIVKKCKGNPLVIKAIASILYFKNSEAEWLSFNDKELLEMPEGKDNVLETLKLSYNHLPSQLKPCFAYCKLFPKDYEIDVQELINLWMAQGFIDSSDSSQRMEDIGYEYFMNLYWRSLFHEVETDELGIVKKCRMHDLIHDLATLVAGTKCAMFASCQICLQKGAHNLSSGFSPNPAQEAPTNSLVQVKRIRTILLPNVDWRYGEVSGETLIGAIVSNFRFLRTLDLHGLGISIVPNSIGKLEHLRYLDLSANYMEKLPNSISRLLNLQTLGLKDCSSLRELPKDTKKLVNLRHLDMRGCSSLAGMPPEIGQMTNLQTLPLFVPSNSENSSGKLNELLGLKNLRGELEIRVMSSKAAFYEPKAKILKDKQHLRSLKLSWGSICGTTPRGDDDHANLLEYLQPHSNLREFELYFYGGHSLFWLTSLTNLIKLSMDCCIYCKHLGPLNSLQSLKILKLHKLISLEYISNEDESDHHQQLFSSQTSTFFFPSLEQLSFKHLPNLKSWWQQDIAVIDGDHDQADNQIHNLPSFPRLFKLRIRDCPKLTCMPLYPFLEGELELYHTSWKPFHQTMRANTIVSGSSSSSVFPLSKLSSLDISDVDDMRSLSENSLTSLTHMRIDRCPELKQLSPGLEYLTALQALSIRDCQSLMEIPESISNLKSLEYLEISECPNLKSLPEGISKLTCLQSLDISGCPILFPRCQKETGDDWPKIAHIPYVQVV